MNSVTAGGPGFVAAGWAEHDPATKTTNAALWSSRDGRQWQRIVQSETAFRVSGPEGIRAVSAGHGVLVAVGRDGDKIVIWTSRDGATWSRVRHDRSLFGGEQVMWNLMDTPGGFVAVGYQDRAGYGVVWTSGDGTHWSRVAVRNADRTFLQAIDAQGSTFVAAGSENTGDFDAAVLTSEDAEGWKRVRVSAFGGPGNQVAHGVAIGHGRAVVVGVEHWNGMRPAAWSAVRADGS